MKTHPLFQDCKVLICIGGGGVGKTTVAASLGLLAVDQGLRVLVLTIDPSRRLASALGISGQEEVVQVRTPGKPGVYWASVLSPKKVFDEFVLRAAGKSEAAAKLLQNPLYQQLSTNLSGSQEFTALEKLYSSAENGQYDLIILDTPPAAHAMEFLEAPGKISALFNEGVARWFREPGPEQAGFLRRFVQSGPRRVLGVLENLTGSAFIAELADFFRQIESWQGRLESRISDVHRLLVSPQTHFCLVTSYDRAQLQTAEELAREIRRGGYHLQSVILNRAFPSWMQKGLTEEGLDPELIQIYIRFQHYYAERELALKNFAARLKAEIPVFQLPDYLDRIYDLEGLNLVMESLKTGEPT